VTHADSTPATVFANARIFDGMRAELSVLSDVIVVGNEIASTQPAGSNRSDGPMDTVIDADGTTLMPGLIDAHVHSMFAAIWPFVVLRRP
jgi:adenine deaminase